MNDSPGHLANQLRRLYWTHPAVMVAVSQLERIVQERALLFDLLQPLANSIDEQTIERRERARASEDGPEDRPFIVAVTARQERDLAHALRLLEGDGS